MLKDKMAEVHVPNEAGVFGARYGVWKGYLSVFTHINPKNGKLWGEDILVGGRFGAWVPKEEVKFI